MGSKKHKKHKSERRDKYEEYSMDRPASLKLILKVGTNSTPEHGNDSPAYGVQTENCGIYGVGYPEKHKKSKKKKKKKDREKKHKHHKERRHKHRGDSSQEEMSFGEDNASPQLQESILNYVGITTENSLSGKPMTKPMVPSKLMEGDESSPMSPVKGLPDRMISPVLQSPGYGSTLATASTPGSFSAIGGGFSTSAGNTPKPLEQPKTPSSCSESGREPRRCVLKLKQSKTPLTKLLDHLLRSLEKRDPHQFFAWPVTDDIAPGYSKIIQKPMDFSTMRQKIEENEYSTLQEFEEDFRLMCENAIRYNHVDTVYHKAAKRLLHSGGKILQPDHLMRSLKPISGYMRELTSKELGFELVNNENNDQDQQNVDSGDEGGSIGADEPTLAQIEEEEKRRARRAENDPKTRFEPFVDDLTPEEVLQQVQTAASNVKKKLSARQRAYKMGFLRQNRDGTTSLKILLHDDNEGPEKVVSLGKFTGKLAQGTGQLQGFREDRRNAAKMVKPLNYGPFSSFAPIYDSRFANLSKEETELVLSTYGDENGIEYTKSILEFTKDSSYASALANGLLDFLTDGEHSKTMEILESTQEERMERGIVEDTFPDSNLPESNVEETNKCDDDDIDFDKLRSLSEFGIDVSFLDNLENCVKNYELEQIIQDQLQSNVSLIEKLHSTQHERLSQPLPMHLSQVQHAGQEEIDLAHQITDNLTQIAKHLPPGCIAEPHALRKAMGMSDVGLPAIDHSELVIPPLLQEPCDPLPDTSLIDVDQVPTLPDSVSMDIDGVGVGSSTVDLEDELREFLENGTTCLSGSHNDDNSIEQMLLN